MHFAFRHFSDHGRVLLCSALHMEQQAASLYLIDK